MNLPTNHRGGPISLMTAVVKWKYEHTLNRWSGLGLNFLDLDGDKGFILRWPARITIREMYRCTLVGHPVKVSADYSGTGSIYIPPVQHFAISEVEKGAYISGLLMYGCDNIESGSVPHCEDGNIK